VPLRGIVCCWITCWCYWDRWMEL